MVPACPGMTVHVPDRTGLPIAVSGRRSARIFDYAIPAVFVLLWASGFVVPRAFAPYAEPLTFVAARNAGAAIVLLLIALVLRRPWPRRRVDQFGLLWAGALLQGFFLMAGY